MSIILERLKQIIEENFSPPFLEEDMVSVKFIEHAKEKTLQLKIGCRDVWINENGKVTAAGTDVT